jgi:hypothetical protein
MLIKYKKTKDEFTTRIGDDTYVHVPDDIVLPEQSFDLEVGMGSVTLTDELRAEIKAASPHVRLANERVVEKIRAKYTGNDEMKMHREYVETGATAKTQAYLDHVADCRAWGATEKAKIGL